MADIYLTKKDLDEIDIFFDIGLDGNNLIQDDSIRTATLISIFTDGSKPQVGKQIDGKILGNKYYNINKLSQDNVKLYTQGLYDALQWLIDDSIVNNIDIINEKIGNRLNTVITFTLDSENTINVIFNLDEKMNILDEV